MTGKAGSETGKQRRKPYTEADRLALPLARMAEALAAVHAPVGVRNRCAAEARRRSAESWRGSLHLHTHSRSALWNAKSVVGAAAASLLAAAAICWIVFAPTGFESLAHLLPASSGSSAILRGSAAPAEEAAIAPAGEEMNAGAAGYVSLPYSDPSISNGTETAVEVSVPVSQLIAWGVPAPGREPDDVIPVELVLGDDGLPRAVQVLSETSSTANEEIYP